MVDGEVTSWDILFSDEYAGSVIMMNSQRDTIGLALKALGYSMNTREQSELEAARDLLIQQKQNGVTSGYLLDETKDKMVGNEAALAVVYSGDALYAMDKNEALDYAVPEEGSNIWVDGMCIPEGQREQGLREAFIDFMCREDIAQMNMGLHLLLLADPVRRRQHAGCGRAHLQGHEPLRGGHRALRILPRHHRRHGPLRIHLDGHPPRALILHSSRPGCSDAAGAFASPSGRREEAVCITAWFQHCPLPTLSKVDARFAPPPAGALASLDIQRQPNPNQSPCRAHGESVHKLTNRAIAETKGRPGMIPRALALSKRAAIRGFIGLSAKGRRLIHCG